MEDSTPPTIHDIIIVGAGPCGLAVAARLSEHTPSAIFTDDEHQRYNWIRRHARHMTIKNRKTGADSKPKPEPPRTERKYSTLVLDGSGSTWMAKWNRLFRLFDIKHLRSPMFFHVDPGDRDGMLAYTYEHGREHELVEIRGCVGKELSKHQKKKKRASGK
ncbi:FAD binding domain-containing protein [Pseudovirgaria hyperparasitica]|uniref:FAD binding domain-containing protein n=1 Tax=Pseudovirgaria hyperparasitica TaxID=470096 RepID=A0A6A6WIP8_9PEZI|nr:FAD binding domain-containing protein [Pseudovirgaria hyperparasitica]KAF2762179.1 FAD binding domain-containing protein [Pseudovirgaria hyperparasitica]